jgi:hypothetical protein
MLLATTIMLLVFRSPSATVSVMWLISAKMFINEKPPFPLRKFHSIANLCATLNAATTFVMFIIYGTKFRSEFTRIYCCFLQRTKRKKNNAVRQRHEHQQMKPLLNNNNQQNQNEIQQSIDAANEGMKFLTSPSHSSSDIYQDASRQNSILTTLTTTPSFTLLVPMIRTSHSERKDTQSSDHSDDSNHLYINNDADDRLRAEDVQSTDDRNDTHSSVLSEMYYGWWKKCVSCH